MSAALDAGQRAVVEIDPGSRQVVVAGPGSGKTEVVGALLLHLAEEGVDLEDEALVLSFSRAAVRAVRDRLGAETGTGVPACIRTIDSLAARVLAEESGEPWEHLSFDARISAATPLLQSWDPIGDLAHVVIDEFQDIVGARADLVLALLEALEPDAGFTVLGDPAQAIYDFQLRNPADTDTARFHHELEGRLGAVTTELTGQYRARTRDATRAINSRQDVLTGGDALTELGDDIPQLVPFDDVVRMLPRWQGRTAFLTSNNGEAAVVAHQLWAAGIRAHLQGSVLQPLLRTWIGSALGDHPTRTVGREVLERLGVPDLVASWTALRQISDRRTHDVDLVSLAGRLAVNAPPALVQDPRSAVVVSTVHRAKGLEFENVAIGGIDLRSDLEDRAASRVAYVAATRARDRLITAALPDDAGRGLTRHPGTGRWLLRGHQRWQTRGFEIRLGDVDRSAPFADSREAQRLLAERVGVGEALTLRLDPRASTLDIPVYTVAFDGTPVARTSSSFGRDVAEVFGSAARRRRGSVSWPGFTGARVRAVETVAGASRRSSDVGRWGLWLAVVPGGIVRPVWKEEESA